MSTFDGMHCDGVDPELFYPIETDRAGIKKAKDICAGCPAMDACLDLAMTSETGSHQYRHGVFAGTTPRQRYDMARRAA